MIYSRTTYSMKVKVIRILLSLYRSYEQFSQIDVSKYINANPNFFGIQ